VIPDSAILHAELLQEPWFFTVDQVAGLTRWQVERLYLQPARERAEREDRRAKGMSDRAVEEEPIGDRAAFVAESLAAFPPDLNPDSTPERWAEIWAAMKAEEELRGG
jgi:hypothetical protein